MVKYEFLTFGFKKCKYQHQDKLVMMYIIINKNNGNNNNSNSKNVKIVIIMIIVTMEKNSNNVENGQKSNLPEVKCRKANNFPVSNLDIPSGKKTE